MQRPGKAAKRSSRPAPLAVPETDRRALVAGEHTQPHAVLGAHPATVGRRRGTVIRAFHPEATAVWCLVGGWAPVELEMVGEGGLYAGFLAGVSPPIAYQLRFHFASGDTWVFDDPYRFLPTVGDMDLHLFNEGTHRQLWTRLGAHARTIDGVDGVAFAVWAPSARRVSVVGDFCRWDGRILPMRALGSSGIFELFVPAIGPGSLYKFEIRTRDGDIRRKADPYGNAMEMPPGTASRVVVSSFQWSDHEWMQRRAQRDPTREPMAIYEVHVGSWVRVPEEHDRPLTYRELAPKLVEHVTRLGFTHIELLPIMEHPFAGSWGYQVSGYYAPTSRYGTSDDFRFFVDYCHRHDIGVILDWVPAHFPKDDFALRRFDGSALYEHEDWRRGEHPDWGTLIFNYGRKEVTGFLIANALYWLSEFHIDGLRVDAVASMLYLDYSREEGQWIPNEFGGRENLEAVAFLKALNDAVATDQPGCFTVAEESTAWSGVTQPTSEGGLGFTFKWNMGWMHDTLEYFKRDPVHRSHHQDQLSFAMIYEYSERFIMPLSHDEVVHGKGSLFSNMPGDQWQKLANLRALYTYQYTRPGKQLLFMGAELASDREWNHDVSLDWHLMDDPNRAGLSRFLVDLGALYRELTCLWRRDPDPDGFSWIDCGDLDNSILSYIRRDGDAHAIVVLNLTPVPRDEYRIGVPRPGRYRERLSSDRSEYGGSGFDTVEWAVTDPAPFHGLPQSIRLRLPPLGAVILQPSD
jgi:1,4-alpha-glucan branching enzyme